MADEPGTQDADAVAELLQEAQTEEAAALDEAEFLAEFKEDGGADAVRKNAASGGDAGSAARGDNSKADSGAAASQDDGSDGTDGKDGATTPNDDPDPDNQIAAADAGQEGGGDGKSSQTPAGAAATPDLQSTIDRLHRLESRVGRDVSSLTKLVTAAQQGARAEGGSAPTQAQVKAASESKEAMDKLKSEHPEFGAALGVALEAHVKALDESIKGRLPSGEVLLQQIDEVVDKRVADTIVEMSHEGWKDTVQTPDFKAWYAKQPANIQALGASERPRDSIRLLDAFGKRGQDGGQAAGAGGSAKDLAQRRLEGSVPATGSGANRKARVPTEQEDFEAAFKAT